MATEVAPPPLSSIVQPPTSPLTPNSASHSHHSFEHSHSGQNGVSASSYPPPPPVVLTATQSASSSSAAIAPAPSSDRSFSEYLHDHFDSVFKRVTMGRRDLKAVHAYLSQRAQTERQYADRLSKEAHGTPELADSSSAGSAWTAVKEQAAAVSAQHAQLASVCVELSAAVDKTVREMKTTKTSLQQRYNKLVDDCKQKQLKHDKARDAYGDAVKSTESAIQARDNGRSQPPPQQQKLETQVSRQLAVLNQKHEEYKRSVQVLKDAQVNYDAQIIEIMQQFERTEQDRLAALHAHLQRYGQQHETLGAADVAVGQALLRSAATIDNRRDIQEYISSTTTNTKPRPHIEYHAINSAIIEQNANRAKMPPSGPSVAPGVGMAANQPPQPPVLQQQFGAPAPVLVGGAYPATAQQQYQQPPGVVVSSSLPPPNAQFQQPAGQSPSGAKLAPPPITAPFVPPPVNYATSAALALYDFDSSEPDDLTFKQGDVIVLKASEDSEDWWTGELRGRTGIFPKTYVQKQQVEGAVASSVLVPSAAAAHSQPAASVVQPPLAPEPVLMSSLQSSAPHNEPPPSMSAMTASAVAVPASDSSAAAPAGVEQPREMDARCEALFDFSGQDVDELSFKKGDQLIITGELNGWYLGKIEHTPQVGIFPSNYVSVYP